MHTFKVHFSLNKNHSLYLDQWVKFAIASGTEYLELNFREADVATFMPKMFYEFPFQLFSDGKESFLKHLHLTCCSLKPPPNFDGFCYLKELVLDEVSINDIGVLNVLCSCFVLESLTLRSCQQLVYLVIAHPSFKLQCLNVYGCPNFKTVKFFKVSIGIILGRRQDLQARIQRSLKHHFS